MTTAKNVAEYFLMLSQPDIGDYMSNLRLQKLVYYAQGFHLAKFGTALFNDEIVAWNYGPVVESLYHDYKVYRSGVIPQPSNPDFSMFTAAQKELMDEIFVVYGQFSALKLMELTHNEEPWMATLQNHPISHEIMAKFFKKRLRN